MRVNHDIVSDPTLDVEKLLYVLNLMTTLLKTSTYSPKVCIAYKTASGTLMIYCSSALLADTLDLLSSDEERIPALKHSASFSTALSLLPVVPLFLASALCNTYTGVHCYPSYLLQCVFLQALHIISFICTTIVNNVRW